MKKSLKILVVERLNELMREENLNQSKLAERIGVKQNTISAWLRGRKEPSITSLWLLADFFNVEVDFIIGRKDY